MKNTSNPKMTIQLEDNDIFDLWLSFFLSLITFKYIETDCFGDLAESISSDSYEASKVPAEFRIAETEEQKEQISKEILKQGRGIFSSPISSISEIEKLVNQHIKDADHRAGIMQRLSKETKELQRKGVSRFFIIMIPSFTDTLDYDIEQKNALNHAYPRSRKEKGGQIPIYNIFDIMTLIFKDKFDQKYHERFCNFSVILSKICSDFELAHHRKIPIINLSTINDAFKNAKRRVNFNLNETFYKNHYQYLYDRTLFIRFEDISSKHYEPGIKKGSLMYQHKSTLKELNKVDIKKHLLLFMDRDLHFLKNLLQDADEDFNLKYLASNCLHLIS